MPPLEGSARRLDRASIEAREPGEALGIADQRLYVQKHAKGTNRGQTHDVLLQAMYERRPELQERVLAGADLSLSVARQLGLTGEELEQVRRAAELRDVGTIAIPDEILLKAGPLDDEEWAFIRRHTVIGQRILSAAPALLEIAKIVRFTHERWDGLGYPDGLVGESIPLASRIVSVCDAFVAMTSDRPYQARRTTPEALTELRRNAGTQFDPASVALLCETIEQAGVASEAA
jgi:HD-GYP domain-containing protein (c-di-GMP phosphodiesterase class II)